MIAKGHDIPNVTLVGVVLADIGLSMPDFRAAERTFQLLTLRVALRRAAPDAPRAQRIVIDGLVVDFDKRLVSRAGAAVRLTPKEFDLLAVLARNAGRVLTHRHILSAVWGPAHVDDIQYLRVLMGQLRAKIERDPGAPAIVRTEPGVGYRTAEPADGDVAMETPPR